MDCEFHIKLLQNFIDSGKKYAEFPVCDKMGCFHFHPNAQPERSKREDLERGCGTLNTTDKAVREVQ